MYFRGRSYSLFKFEMSYHAMTMNTYLMEQQASNGIPGVSVTGNLSYDTQNNIWHFVTKVPLISDGLSYD